MRLRDLTIYAKEKYHIVEQSGFTIVLASDLPAAQEEYHASAIPFSKAASSLQPASIPEKSAKGCSSTGTATVRSVKNAEISTRQADEGKPHNSENK